MVAAVVAAAVVAVVAVAVVVAVVVVVAAEAAGIFNNSSSSRWNRRKLTWARRMMNGLPLSPRSPLFNSRNARRSSRVAAAVVAAAVVVVVEAAAVVAARLQIRMLRPIQSRLPRLIFQTVIANKDATPDQIKEKLQALRDAKTKAAADLKKSQDDLRLYLTVRQEAVLVSRGILE